jgi:hypothetical protein
MSSGMKEDKKGSFAGRGESRIWREERASERMRPVLFVVGLCGAPHQFRIGSMATSHPPHHSNWITFRNSIQESPNQTLQLRRPS